jgi:HK97 family phage portal protein
VFDVTDPVSGEVSRFTDEIIHIRGISLDGLIGLSPISLARSAISRGMSEDEFAAGFFRNWAIPRGVLQLDGELSPDRMEGLRARWQSLYGGNNVNRIAILEQGMTFHPITMPMEDAQFVEQAKLSVQRIARVFRVPASMIGGESGDSLTYSTVESDALHFERYSLRPWIARIEQALARDRDLFPGEGRSLYPEFVTDAILRADTKTRYESYAIALDPEKGWMRREEVRGLENLPPEPVQPTLVQLEREAARLLDDSAARAHSHTNGGGRRVGTPV